MSSKGAEADLYLEEWFDKKIIRKYRVNKEYRVPELDKKIREFKMLTVLGVRHKSWEQQEILYSSQERCSRLK